MSDFQRAETAAARVADPLGTQAPKGNHTFDLGPATAALVHRGLDIVERYMDARSSFLGRR